MPVLRCVIIEDEKEFVDILIYYLSKIENVEVLGSFGDSVSASLHIEKLKPDIVFLDINISGLEGPDMIDLLECKPKIIIVSGHSENIMPLEYPHIKYHAYIQKPASIEKLKAALLNL